MGRSLGRPRSQQWRGTGIGRESARLVGGRLVCGFRAVRGRGGDRSGGRARSDDVAALTRGSSRFRPARDRDRDTRGAEHDGRPVAADCLSGAGASHRDGDAARRAEHDRRPDHHSPAEHDTGNGATAMSLDQSTRSARPGGRHSLIGRPRPLLSAAASAAGWRAIATAVLSAVTMLGLITTDQATALDGVLATLTPLVAAAGVAWGAFATARRGEGSVTPLSDPVAADGTYLVPESEARAMVAQALSARSQIVAEAPGDEGATQTLPPYPGGWFTPNDNPNN